MVLPWTHAHVCAGAACCFQLVCWHLQRSAPVLVPFCMLLVVRSQKLQVQVGVDDHYEGDCGAGGDGD